MTEPLTPIATRAWREVRDPGCRLCPLGEGVSTACLMGNGPGGRGMVVADGLSYEDDAAGRVLTGTDGEYLRSVLRDADLDIHDLYLTAAVRCAPPRQNRAAALTKAQKHCEPYLAREVDVVRPRAILSLGATAYWAFTHKAGITSNRGKPFDWHGITVVPTLSPLHVLAQPQLHGAFAADVMRFSRIVRGEDSDPKIASIPVMSRAELDAALVELEEATGLLAWDLETRGFVDYRPGYSRVWMIGISRGTRDETGALRVFGVPLEHPESPFLLPGERVWPQRWVASESEDARYAVGRIVRLCLSTPSVGHNLKFDLRHLRSLGRRYGIEVDAP